MIPALPPILFEDLVRRSLLEDLGRAGDVTSDAIIPQARQATMALVARQPGPVGLFVYYHECGHHHVGASELGADCWAVRRGVREGWLDSAGLQQICTSFGNAPATATHPSGARRCSNLNRCFAAAASK